MNSAGIIVHILPDGSSGTAVRCGAPITALAVPLAIASMPAAWTFRGRVALCVACVRKVTRDNVATMAKPTEYDPATCITAGEIRALGFPLDARVPDAAWVSRSACAMTTGRTTFNPATKRATVRVGMAITDPFEWLEVKFDRL